MRKGDEWSMAEVSADPGLESRLDQLLRENDGVVRVEQISEVVEAVLATLSGDLTATDIRVYRELEELVSYIHIARQEIAALRPDEIQSHYIPSATDELDAIVEATEVATNEILDAVEIIENLQDRVDPEIAEIIANNTTRIYESCNFQDITGQRITKVVKALKHIEDKVEALVAALWERNEDGSASPDGKPKKETTDDSDLLNGPQLPANAFRQEDIDALFASFG